MPPVNQAVFWIISHWKTWIVPVINAVAGGVTWISTQRKNRGEIAVNDKDLCVQHELD
jgi:hypothetical protein